MPSGGPRKKTRPDDARGRPINPPRISLSQTIAELREDLGRKPADVRVGIARAALVHLEVAQEAREELRRLREVEARFNAYLASWEPLWDAARERGIEIGQVMGQDDWTWRYQERSGRAPTPGEALLEALAAPARGEEWDGKEVL